MIGSDQIRASDQSEEGHGDGRIPGRKGDKVAGGPAVVLGDKRQN